LACQIGGLFVSDIVAMGFKVAFFTVTNAHEGRFADFGDHLVLLVLSAIISMWSARPRQLFGPAAELAVCLAFSWAQTAFSSASRFIVSMV
jgi:hypothetical protein